jgi:hypothetical protein
MLEESIALIHRMWSEESVTHRGDYFTVEDARILDRPAKPVPIVISAFGEDSAELAARIGDGLWLSSLNADTIATFEQAGGSGPIFSHLTLCLGTRSGRSDRTGPPAVAQHRTPRPVAPGTQDRARL